MLLFLDMETTGLNPQLDDPLEIGMTLTNDDLVILTSVSYLIRPLWWPGVTPVGLERLARRVPEIVFDMHTKSGLFADVDKFGLPLKAVEHAAVRWLTERNATGLPTAGSSVHFDRSFTKQWMPTLDETLHYRCIDVSTLKELARSWKPGVMLERRVSAEHRVMADIADSITELAHYKKGLLAV
jgi:oligoribonuclease